MFTFKPYVDACFKRAMAYRRQSVFIAAWGAALFASLGIGDGGYDSPILGIPPFLDWLSAVGLALAAVCLAIDARAARAEYERENDEAA